MIKTIDRYIISQFLKIFLFVALIFSLISVAIDLSEKLQKLLNTGLGIWPIIEGYFFGFVLFINSIIWSLYVLITCIFLGSRLGRNNEIISILNGGVSFWRILRPFLIGAGIVCLFHLWANHFLVPIGDKKRVDFEHTYFKKDRQTSKNYNIHQMLTPESKIYIRSYNPVDSTAFDVRIENFENKEIKDMWTIKRMKLVEAPYKWELEKYFVRTFDGDQESLEYHLDKEDKIDTILYVNPNDFGYVEGEERGYTTPKLLRRIQAEKLKGTGRERVFLADLHRRSADAIMDIILTLLAVSISTRKARGGFGKHLAMGVIFGAAFVMISRMIKFVALSSQMPIGLGIWLPNIIFLGIAIYFLTQAQK